MSDLKTRLMAGMYVMKETRKRYLRVVEAQMPLVFFVESEGADELSV